MQRGLRCMGLSYFRRYFSSRFRPLIFYPLKNRKHALA